MSPSGKPLTSIEICAGAGGQAIGLHQAGFKHLALVEIDAHAVETLKLNIENRDEWCWENEHCDVISGDVREYDPAGSVKKAQKFLDSLKKEGLEPEFLDLLAGGVPCPPFSHAGKQLGKDDERDLFPDMIRLVGDLRPKAVMIENVRGIMDAKFDDYREWIAEEISAIGTKDGEGGPGYNVVHWKVLEASDFGVPQLRPRAILVAFRRDIYNGPQIEIESVSKEERVTVLDALRETMRARYEEWLESGRAWDALASYRRWYQQARQRAHAKEDGSAGIAPTLVGGSKKHGGADLGPSRAKAAWKALGVCGLGVANDRNELKKKKSEDRDLFGPGGPMLTVQQAAIIQGFPKEWEFAGGKTAQYRQVGNAFPPPVAAAVGLKIAAIIQAAEAAQAKPPAQTDSGIGTLPAPALSDHCGDLAGTAV